MSGHCWARIAFGLVLLYGILPAGSTLFAQEIEGSVVDSVTGLPIGGANVLIEAGGKPVYQSTTDDRGVFRIQAIKAGSYSASFSKHGFIPSAQDASHLRFDAGADSIHLQGRLKAWSRVSGRVLDESGQPVSGAELLLDGSLRGQTSTSDEAGNFLFRAAPGSYLLSARPPGGLSPPLGDQDERSGWAHTYYPGVLDRSAAVKIPVTAGLDVLGRDIMLRTARFIRVRGMVWDDKGDPAAQVSVQAGRIDETLSEDVRVMSKEDGSFEFPSLPEGQWRVFAEVEGRDRKLRASALAEVMGRDLERLELRLMPPFVITGNVALVPAEGAQRGKKALGIFLQPLVAGSEGLSQTATDSNGNFRIDQVYPGKYKIVAISPGPRYFLNSVRMGSRELLGQFVDLVSGTIPVEIQFESEGGSVRGMVEHCAGGMVVLAPQDRTLQEPHSSRQLGAETRDDSRLRISGREIITHSPSPSGAARRSCFRAWISR